MAAKACRDLNLEVTPEPPLLKADFGPIDHLGRAPGARFGDAVRRPAGRINSAVGSSASSAVSQQSYGVKPQIHRSTFSGDLHDQVMGKDIGFLVRHAAGFGGRHVCAIAYRVDIVPFRPQGLVIDTDS